MNEDNATVRAMAIRNGRIVAVGTDEEIPKCAAAATRIVDLQNRTVLPGLIDVHNHAMSWAVDQVQGVIDVRYPNVRPISRVKELVRQRASKLNSVASYRLDHAPEDTLKVSYTRKI